MKPAESYESFEQIKERLDQIVQTVSDDSLPLEEALSLYEEAVKLGTRVSGLIEAANESASEQAPSSEMDERAQEEVLAVSAPAASADARETNAE